MKENGKETKLVFSGDLGQPDQPILRDPTIIHGADFVITESTYGDRLHQLYDKETALIEIVNETMDRGGNLIIPSFCRRSHADASLLLLPAALRGAPRPGHPDYHR